MALIYRRVAFLAGARAEVQPLARAWGVLIWGHIGRNSLRVLEQYNTRKTARIRRREVNEEGVALIESVEEILYPLSAIVPKFDTTINKMPSLPPREEKLEPFSSVESIYGQSGLRKRG